MRVYGFSGDVQAWLTYDFNGRCEGAVFLNLFGPLLEMEETIFG